MYELFFKKKKKLYLIQHQAGTHLNASKNDFHILFPEQII